LEIVCCPKCKGTLGTDVDEFAYAESAD